VSKLEFHAYFLSCGMHVARVDRPACVKISVDFYKIFERINLSFLKIFIALAKWQYISVMA